MTTTTTAPLTRPATFLLARLLAPARRPVPPSRLRQELGRLLGKPPAADGWGALVEELAEAGLVATGPLRLTASGRAHALEVLGIQHLPEGTTWRTLKDRYLVPHALGLPRAEAEARSRIDLDRLGSWLLRRRYNLPAGTGHTLNAALEALACRLLGYPGEAKLEAVRDRVLCRELEAPETLTRKELATQWARKAAGAPRTGLAAVREAVLRDWLAPPAPQAPSGADGEPAAAEAFDLPAFAATVLAAARTCPTGRFGDNKVFVHHVWSELRGESHLPVRSLDEFKRRLAEANHAGLLRLSRADLVQAMDPDDVRQAETRYLGAVFHFIRTEGGRP